MIFGIITLITALVIAGIAAWFSIAGLMIIFSAAALPVAIMAGSLEIGKLVTASWLYRNWKSTAFLLKSYLTISVFVLMFITSMGIFGYLSKAHIEQTTASGDNALKVELLDQQISREQKRVNDAELVVSQLDKAVQVLLDNDRIRGNSGAVATREAQKDERESLNSIINDAQDRIATLQDQRLVLSQEQLAKEAEIGPLKYIAELVYGSEAAKSHFDEAVRWIIIILVVVFDPLAIALLIAANQTLRGHGINLEPEDVLHQDIPVQIHNNDITADTVEKNAETQGGRSNITKGGIEVNDQPTNLETLTVSQKKRSATSKKKSTASKKKITPNQKKP